MENLLCKKYFAASNSAEDFVNYFPQIFNRESCSVIYIIKGGPGTGKSRFMRDVATAAEGRGLSVRYYYCSSDSESLDGIIIEEMRVGILDGTAPHTFEPTLSGAFEETINLGEFWNASALRARRDEIEALTCRKSEAYKRCYKLLGAYGKIIETEESIITPYVDRKKLCGTVKRWLHRLPQSQGKDAQIALCRGVGMNGSTKFDSYEKNAKILFTVGDSFHLAHLFIDAIKDEAQKRNMSIEYSCDPIIPRYTDALLLSEAGIAFVVGDDGERKVNIKRFIDEKGFKANRERLKKLENSAKGLEALVYESFCEVRKYHFALEKIYAEAMDFSAKEQYTENFIKKLFKNGK